MHSQQTEPGRFFPPVLALLFSSAPFIGGVDRQRLPLWNFLTEPKSSLQLFPLAAAERRRQGVLGAQAALRIRRGMVWSCKETERGRGRRSGSITEPPLPPPQPSPRPPSVWLTLTPITRSFRRDNLGKHVTDKEEHVHPGECVRGVERWMNGPDCGV